MDKVVIITGATRGIGRSMALSLGKAGYTVIVNGTKQTLIQEVVQAIVNAGGTATGFCADIGDPDAVTTMADAVMNQYVRVDALIHNAGNLQDRKCLHMTDEEWQAVLDVHLNGAFYCIRRVLPYLQENGGDILLMTSTAGLTGSPGQVNYSAAKAGMLGMVWTLAAELQRYQIRVNAIAPAALTDMTRPVISHIKDKCARNNEPFPDYWQVGEAEDVARFVTALLAQPDKELTGEIFGVNGPVITKWQKPVPAYTVNGIGAFFNTWQHQKGR